MADNILVKDATGATKTMRTVDTGTVHVPVHRVEGYDPQDDMLKVKSVQKKFRDSFVGSAVDAAKWVTTLGTGGTATVSGGQLTLASGTTANSESSLLSVETFTVPFRVSFHLTLSQRIANQTFFVEAVSVNPSTLVPDGLHSIGWVFDGTTATQAKYRVQNGGSAALDSAASTVATTAGAGSVFELEPFSDEAWFHSGVLDSNAGRSNSYRRHQQIPDPNGVYKLRLRWLNGGTAPATSTNAVMQFVACQDYAELTAEITAGRGQVVAGQAIGVAVVSMPATTSTVTSLSPSASYGAGSLHHLVSAASTNATSVKTTAANLNDAVLSNNGAAPVYWKLYNKASAPTVGTDTPVRTVLVPAGDTVSLGFGSYGLRLATGLAYAVTTGMAVADTGAVAATQVSVGLSYT